ncbi:MAG: GntR family transcriptional regulator [Fretibacterium sp.]|nr:GntR family transcriptional regulator [Fretibacterium sp.]
MMTALKALAADSDEKLKERVDRYIREQIFQKRTLRCGDRIHERELARTLGLSRTPIREALKELEEQGLVVAVKYRGWFVADFHEEEVQEINKIRTLLEYNLFEFLLSRGGLKQEDLLRAEELNRRLEEVLCSDEPEETKSFEFAEREMDFHLFLYSLPKEGCYWTKKLLLNISYQIRCTLHRWVYQEEQMRIGINSHTMLINSLKKGDRAALRQSLFKRLDIAPWLGRGAEAEAEKNSRERDKED